MPVWAGAPVVTGAAGVLAAYLVLAIPLAGLASRRELSRRLMGESGLRLTLYRRTISRQSLLAAAAVALVGLAKLPVSRLGCAPVSFLRCTRPGVAWSPSVPWP